MDSKMKMDRIFVFAILAVLGLSVYSCDDREVDFLTGNSSFLFSADIGEDTLYQGQIYPVALNIRMKDSTQMLPQFTLSYQVENGTGVLYQNGSPFQIGDSIKIDDDWTYQPTALGAQQLQLTLSDPKGSQEQATIEVEVLELFEFSAGISQDPLEVDEIYALTLNIQLKDNTATPLNFTLNYQVENGSGILYQNGNPFQNGGAIKLNDTWTYKPTSIGSQSIQLTLSDQNEFKENALIEVEVLAFIPVPFSVGANFTQTETFIQIEAGLEIKLESDDPEMKYVLNYEILQGAGEVRDNAGKKINADRPLPQGTSNWKYFPTGANQNEVKFTVRDENGEERTSNASIFVDPRIPFQVASTVQPETIRQNKNSAIVLNISSTHPLSNTLNLTMRYSSAFGSQATLLDASGSAIAPNSPFPVNKGNNSFTYQPVVAGTHSVTFSVSDEQANSESSTAVVNAQQLKPPQVQAESQFRLGSETCSGNNCEAPLFLDIDLGGSVDGDANLGGSIVAYRLVIDRIEYAGDYNTNNPVVSIANGVAKYKKGEGKVYSNVVHRPNTAIQAELKDDDGLWSAPVEISAPGSLPD